MEKDSRQHQRCIQILLTSVKTLTSASRPHKPPDSDQLLNRARLGQTFAFRTQSTLYLFYFRQALCLTRFLDPILTILMRDYLSPSSLWTGMWPWCFPVAG